MASRIVLNDVETSCLELGAWSSELDLRLRKICKLHVQPVQDTIPRTVSLLLIPLALALGCFMLRKQLPLGFFEMFVDTGTIPEHGILHRCDARQTRVTGCRRDVQRLDVVLAAFRCRGG